MLKNEKLKIEIDRLRNFRSGLKKQVEHYDQLLREMLIEYAVNEAKYSIGSIVVYINGSGYNHTGIIKSVSASFYGEDKIHIKYNVEKCDNEKVEEIHEAHVQKLIGSDSFTITNTGK